MRRDDDWNHFGYRYGEGQQARIDFDVRCALFTPESHTTCVRVRTSEPEAVEARLAALDESVWLVGRMHYADACTLVLQCEDPDPVRGALPNAALEQSEGWGFFDERVCPTEADWRRITDREQLDALVRGGLEPLEPRAVLHRFYGSPSAISQLVEQLTRTGMTLASAPGDRVQLQKVHPPVSISEVSVPLLHFARDLGVAYDGWSLG